MQKFCDSESLAEFLGAFTLLFVGAGFVVVSGGANIVGVALAHGLAIATMVAAFGYISGAVFNPAVSFGPSFFAIVDPNELSSSVQSNDF